MKDFSDFIPILIAVGYGLYHLSRFIGKGKPTNPQTPPPRPSSTPPPPKRESESWDDLLEALGQKEIPKGPPSLPPANRSPRIEPVLPRVQAPANPSQTIPPVVRRSLPAIPKIPVSTPISESYEFYQPTISDTAELKFKTFDSDNASASQAAPDLPSPVSMGLNADKFRRFLSDRDRLREAIVLNEILSKPLALR